MSSFLCTHRRKGITVAGHPHMNSAISVRGVGFTLLNVGGGGNERYVRRYGMLWCERHLEKVSPLGVRAIQAPLHHEQGGVQDRHDPDEACVLNTVGRSTRRVPDV